VTRPSPVPAWVPDDLPAAPGVYRFEADGGTVLYVGKSVNLRRRVRSYFYGGGPRSERMREMLALARRVRWTPTGSDLEARLEEAERIVAGRPRYNRALKNRARGWYLVLDWRDPFPRLVVGRKPRAGARCFGPYRGRAAPAAIAELVERIFGLRSCAGRLRPDPAGSPCLALGLDLCGAPCIGREGLGEYRARVARAERVLEDPAWAVRFRARLVEAREKAAARLAYERAARIQRRLDWLDELEARRAELERPWVEGAWLIALPGPRPGSGVLVPMVGGRVLPRRRVTWHENGWRAAVAAVCWEARVATIQAGPVLEPAELVPALLVTGWLLDGAPGGLPLDLERLDDDEVVERLAASAPGREASLADGSPDGEVGGGEVPRSMEA